MMLLRVPSTSVTSSLASATIARDVDFRLMPSLQWFSFCNSNISIYQGWKNLGFWEKGFWFFLGFKGFLKGFKGFFFRFQCINKTGHKISTQEEHPVGYTILSVTLFYVNYNKTHKSQLLKCEIKYYLYIIWPKIFFKPLKPKYWTFEVLKFFREPKT